MNAEPIRVLQIMPAMDAGGMETFVMNVYRTLDREQVQFDFLYHYDKPCFFDDEIRALGGRIYKLTVRQDNNLSRYLRELRRLFAAHPEWRIIHGHYSGFGMFYNPVARRAGIPVRCGHSHNTAYEPNLVGRLDRFMSSFFSAGLTDRFACSEKAGQMLYGSKPFTVVPNGIDTARFAARDPQRRALLRGELGFNGLICTDATTMAGYTLAMSRRRAVPESIARGADMFLFARNLEEDYGFMLQGIKDGIITPERLDEAVTRILATKAALGLHRGAPELDVEKAKTIIGCAKHQQWAEECADKAITLVKEQPGVLPITPERYKKILFYTIEPAAGGEGNYKVAPACAKLRAMLEKEGFEIDDFVPQPYGEGFTTKYEEVVNNYDLILYVANLSTKSNQTVVRIEWKQPMGADCGHYMNDIPTVFVSLENPYHLQDFPRVKTYINCYSNNDHCLHQLIEKLTGRSTFKGHSPVDAFCGKWDAHL